jgi:hypothetical protein
MQNTRFAIPCFFSTFESLNIMQLLVRHSFIN